MVEMVVMMAIIVVISGMVLVGFTGLHEGSALNRAVRELALSIRGVQNTSLAVTQIDTRAGPKIPAAVGIRLMQGSPAYTLFADLTRDNKYDTSVISDEPDARMGDDRMFEGGIKVSSLTYVDALNNPRQVSVAHIIFAAPEASVLVTDQDGAALGDTLVIELQGVSGTLKKTVTVRTSGQISIK
jgi:hypothetical protein